MLSSIDALTHFSYRWEPITDEDTFFEALATASPSLKYIETGSRRSPFRWVVIDRSPDGAYVGYNDVMELSKDMDVESWGDYYRGVNVNEIRPY